jgi:hypothetical protein
MTTVSANIQNPLGIYAQRKIPSREQICSDIVQSGSGRVPAGSEFSGDGWIFQFAGKKRTRCAGIFRGYEY